MTDRATTGQKLFPRVIRADTSVTNYGNKPFVESTTRFPIDLRRRKALPRDSLSDLFGMQGNGARGGEEGSAYIMYLLN